MQGHTVQLKFKAEINLAGIVQQKRNGGVDQLCFWCREGGGNKKLCMLKRKKQDEIEW